MWLLLCLILLIGISEAQPPKGKDWYDLMVAFINNYINDWHYRKTIQSIYDSQDWKTLDAQYGPFIHPTPNYSVETQKRQTHVKG
jgi:hypothetical protein